MAVRLLKNVKLDSGWKLLPVAYRNGKPRWSYVLRNGAEEHHPEGNYHLDYRDERGMRHRPAVGRLPGEVMEAVRRKEAEIRAIAEGVEVVREKKTEKKTRLRDAAEEFLRDVSRLKSKATYRKYKKILDQFMAAVPTQYVEDVSRRDLMDFMGWLHEDGCGGRTVENKTIIVLTWLKTHGKSKLLLKQDWPEYVNAEKRPYDLDVLQKFFAGCDAEDWLLFQFFLNTGFRDQEVRVTEYNDVDFKEGIVRVREKPYWNFKPKGKEIRDVPIPDVLLKALADRKKKANSRLIFPSPAHWKAPKALSGGKLDDNFLGRCKRVALCAGLNCGNCESERGDLCAVEPCCRDWNLHRFRHTFGTNQLRAGWDIETVATWMGHQSLDTLREYLKAIRASEARPKLNKGALAGLLLKKQKRLT